MSDKDTALEELEIEYQNLRQTIDGLDDGQLTRVWFGSWAIRDIIAHVMGWEREMIVLLERLARGERPVPEGVDYSNSDDWNAKFAREMAPISPATVLATWQQTHMNFVRAARSVPDDRYGVGDEGRPKTANRILEGNGSDHYKEHGAQIREWRQREGL